ncbi:hypothetical protein, partial [Streptococcus gordonii]|uniref:hypothetical protein n=1 Tax=Streptococcus gordonii TaxID=1302 RepID=UPI001C8CC381
ISVYLNYNGKSSDPSPSTLEYIFIFRSLIYLMLPFQTTSTLNKPEMIDNLGNIEVSFIIQTIKRM